MKNKYIYLIMLILVGISLVLTVLNKQPRLLNSVVLIGMLYLLINDRKDDK